MWPYLCEICVYIVYRVFKDLVYKNETCNLHFQRSGLNLDAAFPM